MFWRSGWHLQSCSHCGFESVFNELQGSCTRMQLFSLYTVLGMKKTSVITLYVTCSILLNEMTTYEYQGTLTSNNEKRTQSLMSPSHDAVSSFDYMKSCSQYTRTRSEAISTEEKLTVSCGNHSCAMTTFECALNLLLIFPFFQSQNTTFPSLSPLLIHLPSGENPIWQA